MKVSGFRLVALFLALVAAPAAATDSEPGALPSLKAVFADAFRVGAALNRRQLLGEEPAALELVARQFNSVTAENAMKWERIEPREGEFDWTAPDALVAFAEAHGMYVAGHVLVWHQQTPEWVFQDSEGNPASRELLLARMEKHISAVVGRYRGRVHAWEVVNEALADDGSLRRTPWLELIGEDYIEKAFEFAHRADPGAGLYYNDYSMYQPARRVGAVRLVKALQDKGLRVDAIGMQAHYGLGHPEDWSDFAASIEAFAALGVKVHITELDISVLPPPDAASRGADLSVNHELNARLNPYVDGLPADVEQAQIGRYVNLFRVLLDHRDSVSRVTFWGVDDGGNWKNDWPVRGRTDYPLLFDRQGQPKPVFHAVIGLAAEHEIRSVSHRKYESMFFDPHFLKVEPGDRVTFVVTDFDHQPQSVLVPAGAEHWKAEKGKSITVTFNQEGIHIFDCAYHNVMGMAGVILVGKPVNLEEARLFFEQYRKNTFAMNKDRLDPLWDPESRLLSDQATTD